MAFLDCDEELVFEEQSQYLKLIQVFETEIPKHVRILSNFTENELRCVLFQI